MWEIILSTLQAQFSDERNSSLYVILEKFMAHSVPSEVAMLVMIRMSYHSVMRISLLCHDAGISEPL